MSSGASTRAVPASQIEMQAVEWLLPGWVPFGSVTLLAGDPGLGKSLLSINLAARLSRGEIGGGQAASLLVTAEDSLQHVVVPRLVAAKAELDQIYLGSVPCTNGLDQRLAFPQDADRLRQLIDETSARFVVIDPLMAHLPGTVNSWRDQSVRHALAPIAQLAEATNAAIVLICHLNKGQGTDPLKRIGGSIGIAAAARSVLLLGRHPSDPEGDDRVLAHVKSNMGRLEESRLVTIKPASIKPDGVKTATARINGRVKVAADELLVERAPGAARTARNQGIEYLRDVLESGPKPVKTLREGARERGISPSTLKRARKDLCLVTVKDGTEALWQLPAGNTEPDNGTDTEPDSGAA